MPRVRRSAAEQDLVDREGPVFLEVLARGLRVLALFNDERRDLTLGELAERADLPRASVRRILGTFERLGFVEADGRLFRLLPRVLVLASAYLTSNAVPAVMDPLVKRIARELGEACSVAVLDGDNAVMVARAAPVRIVSVGLELGFRLPLYCSAVGRVLLGAMADDALASYLDRVRPERLTGRTLVDPAAIRDRVLAARSDGFAVVEGEVEEGFSSVAVPVHRRDGSIACALHLGLPSERADAGRIVETILPRLVAGAAESTPLLL